MSPDHSATAAPLLRVTALERTYGPTQGLLSRLARRAPRIGLRAVRGVDLEIAAGTVYALVGESGCGKSTVARMVAGLDAPTAGEVRFRGRDMRDIAAGATPERAEVQMIFQDPYSSLNPRWTVGRSIADPMVSLRLVRGRAAATARVAGLLEQVGLSAADATKYPHEFSGGQRQRIAIARALGTRPALIICDEPTSALDVSVQAQILNMMRDLQDELGLSYLFITHDLGVVDHIADRVGVMYMGAMVEEADRDTLFARPLHPYTRALLGAVPKLRPGSEPLAPPAGELPDPLNPPSGCAYRMRCPLAGPICASAAPPVRVIGGSRVACHHADTQPAGAP